MCNEDKTADSFASRVQRREVSRVGGAEEISRGPAAGESLQAIAGPLGRRVDGVAGSRQQRRTQRILGRRGRPGGVGSVGSTEADEAGPVAGPSGDGGGQVGVVLVAVADLRVAAPTVPDRDSDGRVARDDPLVLFVQAHGDPHLRTGRLMRRPAGGCPTAACGRTC